MGKILTPPKIISFQLLLILLFIISPDFSLAQSSYPDGLKIEYWDNGKMKLEECWLEGKKEGVFFNWYENGNPATKEYFEKDTLEGVAKYWYENGHKRERTAYKHGKKHGFSLLYTSNGKRSSIHRYKHGKLVRKPKDKVKLHHD